MTTIETSRLIDSADLRAALLGGGETAVVDIREGDAYASGHISVAVPIPDSELELLIGVRVPRRGVRLVVTDADGTAASSAVERLVALGYIDVRVLDGGLRAWAAAGNELITGLNSLSKALGEFVERRQHTPRITVDELKAKIDSGEDIVVLDTRPLPEYQHIAIPTGRPAPGAELLYRVFDQIPSPTTQVVVNCAGRTRAIIGAQALINAGVTNPVVSLENGTSAWLFAGYGPVQGAAELIDDPSPEGLEKATAAAVGLRDRFGIAVTDNAALVNLRADGERTTYLLDVRTPEEYAAGHVPGAVSAPGGQLVQATDGYIGVRGARIVLTDTPDLVRSSITASWLRQLGLDEVSVHAADTAERTETGAGPIADPAADRTVATISSDELALRIDAGERIAVLDLQPAPAYYETRHFLTGSVVSRRSTLLSDPTLLPSGTVVLVSGDGRLARLAAAELSAATGRTVLALDGGIDAWVAAGRPTETGTDQPPLTAGDRLPSVPDLEARKKAFADYVAWGDVITEQLGRDGLVAFREFPPVFVTERFSPPVRPGVERLRELIEHIDSGVIDRDEQARRPYEEFALLKQARIGALRLSSDDGGAGASLVELFATIIDLGEADPNVAHSLRNHFQFVESLLRRPDPGHAVWFDHVRAGRLFGLAATELSNDKAGRRQQVFATAVTADESGLRLNGQKFYSTGNLYADLLIVAAAGPDGKPVRLAIPVDRQGVEIPDDWDGIGQRFTGSGTTRFVNTPVYESDFVGGGIYGDTPYLATFPQLYLTAVIAGIQRRIARDAAAIVRGKQRTFYHSPTDQPTQDPILQYTVGQLASQAYIAEAAVHVAAIALEAASAAHGRPDEHELALRAALRAAKAKVVVDEIALRGAGDLFDVGGGQGVRRGNHLDRHWRNIRTLAAHNPRTLKARAVGAFEIDGTPLPNGAFF